MNKINLSENFNFIRIRMTTYHYTDNRKGSPKHFLARMLKGHARIVSEAGTIQIQQGDIFCIPKDLSYQSYWYGEDEIEFLSFGFLELNIWENVKFALQVVPSDDALIEKIMRIPLVGDKVDCRALSFFYDAMADAMPRLRISAENRELGIVERISGCIRENPFIPLSQVAEMCSISEPYLYALFRKITHTTPNDFRQKVLCELGVQLLLTTDKKVEEISRMINFSSASYFRKVLKKQTGYTPREIRKNRVF